MKIDRESKLCSLDERDLWEGCECPVCGKSYKPNGTGPSNMPWANALLRSLPSELALGGLPPRFHDWGYLVCPAGWTVFYDAGKGVVKASNRREVDQAYFRLMMMAHADSKALAKGLLWLLARINWTAVRWGGKSSFSHCH